jgi:hypothetical protein
MKKELSFEEVYQQYKEKGEVLALSHKVFSDIIFESKNKEGNISKWLSQWLEKPKNKKCYELFSEASGGMIANDFDAKKIKSATYNKDTQDWNFKDSRVVANEMLEAARIKERVLTLQEREDIKAECPSNKVKDIDKLLSSTLLKDDLKGVAQNENGKWEINFEDKELKKELSECKKHKGQTYSP